MREIALEEMKQLELEIMVDIDAFCRKHGLRYYLAVGTLLGAVWHKGFIPWDDDIDIVIPRADYEQFYDLFKEEHRDSFLQVVSYRDKSSIYPFFKVVDTRTVVFEEYVDSRYSSGVWVDIFPLDALPEDNSLFEANRRTKRIYDVVVANTDIATTPLRKLAKKVLKPLVGRRDIYAVARELDQVNKRMDYIGKSLVIQGVLTLAAFCSVFAVTASLEFALASMAIVTVLVGVLYDFPRSSRFEALKIKISRKKTLHLLKYCLPIVVAAVACAAAPSIPRQFLSFSQGEAALGIYASVAAPVAIIQMGASYIYNPLLSVFSEQYAEKRAKDLAVTFCKVVGGIAVVGAVCAIGFELLGSWLLTLIFGQSIEPYTYLLIPVIASTIVSAYVWFFNDLLVALRCFRGSFVGNVVSVIIALPITLFFVHVFGMNGVSFTVIVAYGVGALVMALYLLALVRRGLREESR